MYRGGNMNVSQLIREERSLLEKLQLMQLEKIAKKHGVIITVCAYCKDPLGVKDGRGVYGVSHGICSLCKRRLLKEYNKRNKDQETGK
jgi:transposase-like protein